MYFYTYVTLLTEGYCFWELNYVFPDFIFFYDEFSTPYIY